MLFWNACAKKKKKIRCCYEILWLGDCFMSFTRLKTFSIECNCLGPIAVYDAIEKDLMPYRGLAPSHTNYMTIFIPLISAYNAWYPLIPCVHTCAHVHACGHMWRWIFGSIVEMFLRAQYPLVAVYFLLRHMIFINPLIYSSIHTHVIHFNHHVSAKW